MHGRTIVEGCHVADDRLGHLPSQGRLLRRGQHERPVNAETFQFLRQSGEAIGSKNHPRGTIVVNEIHGFLLRSEEHTSELQSLMRISYAVFCLKKKTGEHTDHEEIRMN